MEPKEYQTRALDQIRSYSELLSLWRWRAHENAATDADFPGKAWEEMAGRTGPGEERGQPLEYKLRWGVSRVGSYFRL
jgi:hypothetical protein